MPKYFLNLKFDTNKPEFFLREGLISMLSFELSNFGFILKQFLFIYIFCKINIWYKNFRENSFYFLFLFPCL